MSKIARIAGREFLATVGTRGFIIGLLIVPAIAALGIAFGPRLFLPRNFQVQGQVAVIDATGLVADELRVSLDPQRIAERRATLMRQSLAAIPDEVRELVGRAGPGAGPEQAIRSVLGGIPSLRVIERPATADVQQEKQWLTTDAEPRPIALVVVHPNAVIPAGGGAPYGAYDLYVAANLEERAENQVHQSVREAIVSARARAQGLEPDRLDGLVRVDRVRSVRILKDAERQTVRGFAQALPFVFVAFLMFGVMMGGQSLLTSTIEEKSSRVIEVLLSAVSPLELMAGKILGQMGVSLVALGLYIALGAAVLVSFALFGLIDPWLLLYLGIFFVISFLVVGSLMAAVGAAVNEMSEANAFMTPIIIILVTPIMLAGPIMQDPNSAFSTAISFVPPVNTFAMLLRLTSAVPPPWWQVWLSIGVGVVSVFAAVWFAAKVFQIGLLMYGKPPNFATLIRWVRAA